jgi:hypothetical protein
MNTDLNQYDKSMFIKNEQGMVDVTNPQMHRKNGIVIKTDHPLNFMMKFFRLGRRYWIKDNILHGIRCKGKKTKCKWWTKLFNGIVNE